MTAMADLEGLYSECREHLEKKFIPFWKWLCDYENGGFYGLVTGDLAAHKSAEKGCVLNSRILWFFSMVYRRLHDEDSLDMARHAYAFLRDRFIDRDNGGLYWSVTALGEPLEADKYCFCQASAVYALSAYAIAEHIDSSLAIRDDKYGEGRSKEALELAYTIADFMEEHLRDETGYIEAVTDDLLPTENIQLSYDGEASDRTISTAISVLEAYNELYKAGEKPEILERLKAAVSMFLDRFYDRENVRLFTAFDRDYNSMCETYSYGHDLEASWLIDDALATIGDWDRAGEASEMSGRLVAAVYDRALEQTDHSAAVPLQRLNGVVDETRMWWVEAEAVNGFLNAVYRATRLDDRQLSLQYAEAVGKLWNFIRSSMIDERSGGEWFCAVSAEGVHDTALPIADIWKGPFHAGRMCLEVIHRLNTE
ncbi:MAG: AGE family epimerase/isomerase [Lachnospiraceae bacterium]|nr:AGE family epimerase/isomerase [Lachnospiraceae bacterium]